MKTRKPYFNNRQRNEEIAGYLFVLPNILGIVVFVALPILLSLILGYTKWNPMQGLRAVKFVGLDNFKAMFSDARLIAALKNNFVYTFAYVPISIFLALLVALALNKKVFCKVPLRLMFFMPYISAMVSVSYVWLILLNPEGGPVNNFLSMLGVKDLPGWFSRSNSSLAGIIIVSVWHDVGYYMIIFLSALQSLPKQVYESAKIDGCGSFRTFHSITLPLMASNILFVSILATMNSFKVFDQINILTEGGPGYSTNVLVYCIYHYAFRELNIGYASSIAVLLFVIILVISGIETKLKDRFTY
ncbi:sugar ABC transporter permease [uncultured Sphaerochaeta sp.]|uniref:carbohydrate ABC transporter permease n=1 Tax=uncultured Sphaerochaeta sp. TaxID=886478 RepID=UPI002A0A56E7|nr:sugar ABC transporter permease [uncultured Sphaerochaeta sp.]